MKLLDHIMKLRNNHYCHALVVTYAYDIECAIDEIIEELGEQFTIDEYINFFESMDIHYEEVDSKQGAIDIIQAQNFNITEYIKDNHE